MHELEKILEEIENERTDIDDYSDAKSRMLARHWNSCIDVVEDIIRKHMNDGWIPVEERLPEKFSIGVEVTTKDLERNLARYAKPPMDMWISVYTGRTLDVIAWKEPSESYHPEGLETREELEEDSKGVRKNEIQMHQ